MEIRPARATDDAGLRDLDQRTWTWFVGPQRPADRAFFAATDPDDVLVAEVGGGAVGYVKLGHRTPLASNRHVLEIQGLAVDPDHTGRRIGRTLVEHAIEEARRRGAAKLGLRVFEPNAAARRIYERCGFEVVGLLRDEFRVEGHSVDDVVMEIRLA